MVGGISFLPPHAGSPTRDLLQTRHPPKGGIFRVTRSSQPLLRRPTCAQTHEKRKQTSSSPPRPTISAHAVNFTRSYQAPSASGSGRTDEPWWASSGGGPWCGSRGQGDCNPTSKSLSAAQKTASQRQGGQTSLQIMVKYVQVMNLFLTLLICFISLKKIKAEVTTFTAASWFQSSNFIVLQLR